MQADDYMKSTISGRSILSERHEGPNICRNSNNLNSCGSAWPDTILYKAEGSALLRGLEEKIRERGVGDPEATYKMAQAHAVLGDKTSALRPRARALTLVSSAIPIFRKSRY